MAPLLILHSIQGWFNEKGYKVIPLCAWLPDLNPIENIWRWIDGELAKHKITA